MVVYFTIKGVRELSEHFGWFSTKRKEKMREAQEKRDNEVRVIVEGCIEKIVPPIIENQLTYNRKQDENIQKLIDSSNDMLRHNMLQIYYKYLPYKKILYYERENFNRLYKDYHSQDGNSFIDHIKQEMEIWPTVMDEKELEI